MTSDSSQHQEHDGVGHVVPVRILFATGIGLLILTGVTVLAAKIDLGEFNIWIALAIALVKGSLVLLIFMHLLFDRPFNAVIIVCSLAFVALFISFALTDTFSYASTIDSGDAPGVVEKLNELGK